ncbi:glycosyltransferase family 4 protein [Oceanithermus sp.]
MRVGFVTDATQIGGSEVWLTQVLPLLPPLGIEPFSAIPPAEATAPIRRWLEKAGVKTFTYRHLAEVPAADVYLVSTWAPPSLKKMLRELRRPVYALVHDQIEMFYPYGLRYVYRMGYRLWQAPLLRQADRVITVSHWAADYLQRIHGVSEVRAIHNGVDLERFRPPEPGEREELKRRFGFGGTVALLPSRFALEKNQFSALRAVRGLEVTLALAGTGPLYNQARQLARLWKVKNAVFLGHVAEMPELYRAADLLFFPTFGENQSLATLEAMASGLPVLTSDIPAQRELVDDGVEGWLAPPWPPRMLRHKLAEILSNAEALKNAGERARKRVEEKHTLISTASALAAALYE